MKENAWIKNSNFSTEALYYLNLNFHQNVKSTDCQPVNFS